MPVCALWLSSDEPSNKCRLMTVSKSNGSIENIFELKVDDNNAILTTVFFEFLSKLFPTFMLHNFFFLFSPLNNTCFRWTIGFNYTSISSSTRVDKRDSSSDICLRKPPIDFFNTDKRTSLNSRHLLFTEPYRHPIEADAEFPRIFLSLTNQLNVSVHKHPTVIKGTM